MKLAFLCFVFGLVLASCGDLNENASLSGTIRALTYNVAGLPEGISGSSPETNMQRISPLLNHYDLVLVQEDFSYHHDLISQLAHPHQSPSMDPSDSESIMTDGLNRFSQSPFEAFSRQKWVACYGGISGNASDCLADKGFSFAIHELGEEVLVHVYNFHAEAGGAPEDNQAREEGYDQLIEYISTHSENAAIIVGADTNLHGFDDADEPVLLKFMEKTGLADVCRTLDCGDEQIDRFFFRSNTNVIITPIRWEVATEFVTDNGSALSDHPAIHVTFDWLQQ